MSPSEKRWAFVIGFLLTCTNLSLFFIAYVYRNLDLVVGVLVIDLVMGALAAVLWVAHILFPDQSGYDDPDRTVEIRRPNKG